MSFSQHELRRAIESDRFEWRKHALQRIAERNLTQDSVVAVILDGERIQEYSDDTPFPSVLYLGWIDDKPLHVLVAFDTDEKFAYIITAYYPDSEHFENDFKTRRN